ncbi:MAG TPA: type II toxin-antitoxin system HicA family toxin [Prolixibacteraceae bacterium]|nr:type II toxin-antitoxin system HicA family toxin [Prolixibacteraceae bacterium]
MNESHKYTECTPFLFRGRVGDGVYFKYFYNSTGEKMLRSVMTSGGTPTLTYYMGPFVHEGLLGGTISLKYIMTPEGRIVNNGTDTSPSWSWEYDLKDHLGNVRVVLGDSTVAGYARVLQQNHYYPFGMRMSQISTALTSTGNDYLYNGKQYQDDFNLNWYDYGARFYDPALGRWNSPDALADEYDSWSPYNYALNNPVLLLDPNGMWVATAGGYSTNDPSEIARFMSYMQAEQAVNNNNPSINQMTGFVEGEMNGGGKLSNGAYLVSDVLVNKDEGGWKVDQESFHQAWVDVYKILSGDKYHFGPVEGEPVMKPLDSWYAKAWYGIAGEREYAGRYVNSQGLLTNQLVPITGMAPTPGIKWNKTMTGKEVVKMLEKSGFNIVGQSGSHVQLKYLGSGYKVTVPVHGNGTLPIGTLKSIMNQVKNCLK